MMSMYNKFNIGAIYFNGLLFHGMNFKNLVRVPLVNFINLRCLILLEKKGSYYVEFLWQIFLYVYRSPANVDAAKEWRDNFPEFKRKVSKCVRKSQEDLL